MAASVAELALLLCAATFTYLLVTTHAQISVGTASCQQREMDALLEFKQGIKTDPAEVLATWRRGDHHNDDCCQWRGVHCSNLTAGHVVELRLGNGNLYDGNALVGEISDSLLSLEHLEHLDLSMNSLQGSSTGYIPEFLGSFNNLKYLNLSGIPFSGRVPPQLGNLSKLQYLDISGAQGTFSLDLSWLPRLRFLQYLNLQEVNLSATANTWPYVVNMIPSLKFIDLSDCLLLSANQTLGQLNLTSLEWLDLSENYFHHQFASCWFWNLTSLKYINLYFTSMYGEIPLEFGSMVSLEFLDLSYNTLSVPMISLENLCSLRILYLETCFSYGDITELIERLPRCSPCKLQELHLQLNNLTGVLPNSMGHLTSLVILDLSGNNITGHLPAFIGNFTSLRTLYLYNNNFTGDVPYEIGLLTNLVNLDLGYNSFDGVITEKHFGFLNNLQSLYLYYTSLKIELSSEWQPPFRLQYADFANCELGPSFPVWLRWMVGIYYLDISGTGINDKIPHWFSNTFSNCRLMDLGRNQIIGDLPRDMEMMSVERLYLNSNNLTGPIPPLPQNLTNLDISVNSLLGPLPLNFGAPKLTELSLFSNRISGRIPKFICKCNELTILDLANNLFEGKFPSCHGLTMLTTLELSNNSLSGDLPTFLQRSTKLQFLDFAWNKFSGGLPTWIGDLVGLQFLRLRHNKFTGNIPLSITNLGCLQYFDIAENGISGSLPSHMFNFTAMRGSSSRTGYHIQPLFCGFYSVPGSYQSVSLSTVMKGQELNYGSSSHILYIKMVNMDLSLNILSGKIPEEIVKLDALLNLNLSGNRLSGDIPYQIGAMESLESLDLSRNELSGEIPASLSNLTSLSALNLSYNNLSGRIPSGSQLDGLYSSNPYIYIGNIGLCGPPLVHNCTNNGTTMQSHLRRSDEGVEFFYLGLGCGFITGIWLVFCTLLFRK